MHNLQRKTITVFGGTGFIGRNLIWQLAKTGANIRVPTRRKASGYFLKPAGDVGQITPVSCNIHDKKSVERVIKGSTHVVNLIGILYEKGKSRFDALHGDLPGTIAKLCTKHGVEHMVHVSALGADANAPSKYGRSKAAGEKAVLKGFKTATILQPSIIFGPDDNFFNMFARMAQLSPALPLIGGGKTKFQPVYVGDVAQAICKALFADDHAYHGKTYALVGPEQHSFRALLEMMLSHTGQNARLVPLPWALAKMIGCMAQIMPTPVLTVDQVNSLKVDNVLEDENVPTLEALGITPTTLHAVLPKYLDKYRSGSIQKVML